tara:strand:- start:1275 stop:2435 length:1161 start_codon:yes stop_codon:yes gene_type:complete
MAEIEKFMSVSIGDIEKIMGVETGDIEKVMGVELPASVPAWLGDRAIGTGHKRIGGSQIETRNMHYRSISSTSHTASFGDLGSIDAFGMGGVQGGGKAVFWGGQDNEGSGSSWNDDNPNQYYVTVANLGDAALGSDMPDYSDSGNDWVGQRFNNEGGGSNGTTGLICPSNRYLDGVQFYNGSKIFYHTISSTAACSVGGDLTAIRATAGAGGATYAFWFGGAWADDIDYVSYSSPSGNAADWGDQVGDYIYQKATEDATRVVVWGGYAATSNSPYASAMKYFSSVSAENASTFGNAPSVFCSSDGTSYGKYSGHAVSNGTRGEKWSGHAYTGYSGSGHCNYLGDLNIDYITIQSTGNAADSGYNFTDLDSDGMTWTYHEAVGVSGT